MKNNPLFSIITVNYNSGKDLKKTIKSVINQNSKNYEYIVIDGGSTDESLDTLKRYEKNIDYWVSEKDKGIYNAMNKGAKVANGKYLFFLNAGDVFSTDIVLNEVEKGTRDEDMVYGKVRVVHKNKEKSFVRNRTLTKFNIKLGNKVTQQCVFVERETIFKFGGLNEKYKIASDYDLLCKLFDNDCSIKKVDILICNYDGSGISSDLGKSYNDTALVIRDRYGEGYYLLYRVISFIKYILSTLLSFLGIR